MPTKRTRLSIALSAVVVAVAIASPPARSEMSPAQIEALLPGVFEAVWKGKRRAVVEASLDGKLSGKASNGWSDKGRWWFKGNEICVSFKWWTFNKPKCGTIEKNGVWYVGFYRSNGEPRVKFRKK